MSMHARTFPARSIDRASAAAVLLVGLVLALAVLGAAPARSDAALCTPPVVNKVACENAQTGTDPSEWQIEGAGDRSIQGFATQMSVKAGEAVNFKIKSETSNYHIDILRLGYYGGAGARRVTSNPITPTNTLSQPPCNTYSSTGLIDCGNWSTSASWTVPSTAVSGVYIAYLKRNDTGAASHIIFVVRDETSQSDMVVQTNDATWQAYNTYGGNSLYRCTVACPPGDPAGYKSAYKVSYNRPNTVAEDDGGRSAMFSGAEYPMIRFLERNGYDVSYLSQTDVEQRGALLKNHKIYMSSGHDEYTSATQRAAIEAARDAGVSLAYFSGNELFWKTRYEPSQDGTNTAARTLVSYKDTHFYSQQDPVSWTGTWRDNRFASAADNVRPENSLTGQSFSVNSGTMAITVPWTYRSMRLWRNTAVASLGTNQSLTLAPESLGYEWDEDIDNGFRPAGEIHLSSTTVSNVEIFSDYGSTTTFGTATHALTMYRAASGALVFATGTVQWSWGLDGENTAGNSEDDNMQQATVNILADMGVQPLTRMSSLISASKSTDTTAPTSTLTSPPSSVADGAKVTLTGTASDSSGGVVAGVEVSTDGGMTYHPATGTTNWTYTWVAHGFPSTKIKTRAADDSGNIQIPGSGTTVHVNCSCSVWGPNVTPPDGDSGDPNPVEVGMRFKSDAFGTVTGLRFFKAATNTGTHTGSLWTADGHRLTQATFTGESASGWQSVTFDTPVEVQPNTTYVVSYFSPNGHYVATSDYFYPTPAPGPSGGSIADSSPLHALRSTGSSATATTNGVFAYTGTSAFPSGSFAATNYWVDVAFTPIAAPGQVTNAAAAAAGKTSANVTWSLPGSGGVPTSYRITPYVGTTAQTAVTVTAPATSKTITGLTTGTAHTFTVQAINPTGSGTVSAQSNSVTPSVAVAPTAPSDVIAEPASRSALVAWAAPGSDGDSAITGYTVTPYVGTTAETPASVSGTATSTTVTGLTNGTAYTFKVTATNAIGTGSASAASPAVTPQATIFEFGTPAVADAGDGNAIEVGTKFKADYNGTITGVRFYKSAANIGQHVGSLWNSSGGRIGQVTFSGETDSGWQSATFSSPVSVTAGSTYVVSYFAPSGHYAATSGGLSTAVDNRALHALANSTSANGVYAYALSSTFPTNSYNATSYSVDVLYALPVPGTPTNVIAVASGTTAATVSWIAPTSGGPATAYRITPFVGTTAQTPSTVDATTSTQITGLTKNITYRFTVQALNANGSGPVSTQSNDVTPSVPVVPGAPTAVIARPASRQALVSWTVPAAGDLSNPVTGYTVTPYDGATAQASTDVGATTTSKAITGLENGKSYTFKVNATNSAGTGPASTASAAVTPEATIFDFTTPGIVDAGDGSSVELGVKLKVDYAGSAVGVRFYKAAANTGIHTGSLWTAGGSRITQVTFTGETATGWQTALFASPIALTAGTTYVVSYFAPNGHYSVTSGGLASAVDNPPLHALSDLTTPNGGYAYGATSTFPSSSYNSGDYGVDVLFDPPKVPGTASGVTATASQGSAAVSWAAPSSGGAPTSYKITPYAGAIALPSTTITGTPPATSKTISNLTPGTAYTFSVTAANASGSGPESAESPSVTPTGAGAPGAPTGVSATPDTTSARVSWTAPDDDGGSMITGYTVTPFIGDAAQASTDVASGTSARITGLTNGTSYTFTVKATSSAGTGPAATASAAVVPQFSIFEHATPTTVDAGDGNAVNLGLKFTADRSGSVSAVRFYKSGDNVGAHVGSLWSSDGTLLRQATFADETASGWQTVAFSSPYPVTAGTTYVVSYLAPNGHYSADGAAFGSGPVDNDPLHALADLASPNGAYAYGATSLFPTGSWNASNYWVDVLFN